jgi:hypothetical protein
MLATFTSVPRTISDRAIEPAFRDFVIALLFVATNSSRWHLCTRIERPR